ncbi:MAG: dihydrofolate reductase [Bacteroidales bacterium]|nr:dihydrofolate reductase [Bacteroidales bacterium]
MKNLSIIVAVGKNLEIGKDNQLLWHISEDLKYFKKNTSGKTIVMGHNTWKSLPFKPLPNRKNIVLSRQKDLQIEGITIVHSIEDLKKLLITNEETFIMGGATIYKYFINIADKMYITRVNQNFDADTFFPEIDGKIWKKNSQSEWFTDEKTNLEYCFEIYTRN